jgi:hypothetical protein
MPAPQSLYRRLSLLSSSARGIWVFIYWPSHEPPASRNPRYVDIDITQHPVTAIICNPLSAACVDTAVPCRITTTTIAIRMRVTGTVLLVFRISLRYMHPCRSTNIRRPWTMIASRRPEALTTPNTLRTTNISMNTRTNSRILTHTLMLRVFVARSLIVRVRSGH